MGNSYLSRPVKKIVSELKSNDNLSYGASSMQGWRATQEDAHNCILDFDDDASFFAVYDGHGGSEVAIYTSQELPKFLKSTDKYKSGLYEEALIDAFLGFDDTIPSPEVLNKLKTIREDQEREDRKAKNRERHSRLRSITGSSDDEEKKEEDDEEADEESEDSEDKEEDEFESAEVLLREACRPVEEVVAAYKQGTSVGGSCGSSSSAGCSSSFLGESSSSFVDSGVGSSSAGSSYAAGSSSAGSSSSGSSSFRGDAACSSNSSSSRSAASSSKSSADENLANGSVSEEPVMNGVRSNGDLDDELKEEKLPKRIPKGPAITINDQPGTSPKKKKLALSDLDDSTVVKNFIANDEIGESDEDDSEDETFEPSNDLDNDEENDDDDDDDDEDDDSDGETRKAKFLLNRNSLVQQLNEHLRRNHGIIVADSDESEDDDDDDADEGVGEEDESADEAKSGEDKEDEESVEEEEEEEEEAIDMSDSGEQPGIDSGCTAVVALIKGDTLYVANAGDSRCVLCKNGVAVEMSEDHKPEDEREWTRVKKAGGRVSGGRIGGLNLSRAIGDHRQKKNTELPNTEQMITALPDVKVAKLEPDVEFIVLACDGIWNSISSQGVVDFIRTRLKENKSLLDINEELFCECLAPDTLCDGTGCDNMTCIIVQTHHGAADNEAASKATDSGLLASNSADGDSSAAEKDAHGAAPQPLPETTSEPAGTDAPMEEGTVRSRNLKRPNDSADEVARKSFKTDDVSVVDSSSVDTASV